MPTGSRPNGSAGISNDPPPCGDVVGEGQVEGQDGVRAAGLECLDGAGLVGERHLLDGLLAGLGALGADVVGDQVAGRGLLDRDLLAAEVHLLGQPLGVVGEGHERDAGAEVVDEVDLLLTLGLVDHRGEAQVVAVRSETADDPVEVGVRELELDAEHLAERLAEVGVEAEHGLVVGVEVLHGREADAGGDPDGAGAPGCRRAACRRSRRPSPGWSPWRPTRRTAGLASSGAAQPVARTASAARAASAGRTGRGLMINSRSRGMFHLEQQRLSTEDPWRRSPMSRVLR